MGKVRLALTPWENHGWHVPLYVSPHGLTTGLVPYAGNAFNLDFDFLSGALVLRTAETGEARLPLPTPSIALFYAETLRLLRERGIVVEVDPMPSEIAGAIRLDHDHRPAVFDLHVARIYWRALLDVHRVFQRFRTRFYGKVSPVHLFWGAFDLAVTRFSGRAAPPHPGGAPHMNDAIAREAYSREVSSAGFWPNLGGADGPSFYSYAYPAPEGFARAAVSPPPARFDTDLGEFVLPYAAVRTVTDPDRALLEFLQCTYDAAADLGIWARNLLDGAEGLLGRPPVGS